MPVDTSAGGTALSKVGWRFSNHDCYAVIFQSSAKQFSGVRKLKDETVAVSGVLNFQKEKQHIILSDPYQIEWR